MDKGKILLFGYYGFSNLGDELFVDFYLDLLKQRFSDRRLIVLVNDPAHYETGDGVEYVSRWNLKRLAGLFAKGDLLLGGGGSLLQDTTSERSLLYYLTLLRLAQFKKARIILAGQGLGPLSPLGARLTAKVLNKVDIITCRDEASVKLLFQINVYRPAIHLGVDPLWGLRGLDLPWQELLPPIPSRAVMGLFLRKEKKERYLSVKEELVSMLRLNFMDVRAMALAPQDQLSLRDQAGNVYLPSVLEIGSLPQMIAACQGLTLVISEKLHGLLLAARLGIPGIGLGGDPKIKEFCHTMGYPHFTWEELCHEETLTGLFLEEVMQIIKNLPTVQDRLGVTVKQLEKKARQERIWLVRAITELLK
ncbi:MAG TPA: hypothetical protein GXZ36_02665 [Firmicutes bacterium]|nr:hypothetical protein [Bacillota bacterium]